MAKYTFIESRDPFESNEVAGYLELAKNLRDSGDDVTIVLVQNGVLPARKCSKSEALSRLADAGVTIFADEFSLRERGIAGGSLTQGVSVARLDVVVDHLEQGHKVLWH